MDYKRLKNQTNAVKRGKILWITVLVMACIIILQAIAAVFMLSSINRYRAMYDEALNGQLTMQEKINSLTADDTEVSGNYETDAEQEIPFVTGGREIENESSIDN